jgi:hypothetical protein
MARNKVMQLWTAFVTAFLALCAALGLVTATSGTAAAASVPQTEPARNTSAPIPAQAAMSLWAWSYARSLPPTIKQRIRAEAHGKTPSCRHLPLTDAEDTAAPHSGPCEPDLQGRIPAQGNGHGHDATASAAMPLQR